MGTSAVKGILVSAEGRQLALARRQTRLLHPEALSWLDGRSVCKTAELLPELDVEAFHAIVG